MYTWKRKFGDTIQWFSVNNYSHNKQHDWKYRSFYEAFPYKYQYGYLNGYVVDNTFDVSDYYKNFTKELPEKVSLYFDTGSKYPRTKLVNTQFKRTIIPNKADVIVIEKPAEVLVLEDPFCIFTDGDSIYGMKISELDACFSGDLNVLFKDQNVGIKFIGELKVLYEGTISLVIESGNSLQFFQSGVYKQPFILDNDLDKIVNSYLPDPDLNALETINSMIYSSDRNVVKLGAIMAAGFNISKWPLTFLCLLGRNSKWKDINAVVIKQMQSTLNIRYAYGLDSVANTVDASKEKYSKEDIELAQAFVRILPELPNFCKKKEPFYLDTLPFIPDEYKQ